MEAKIKVYVYVVPIGFVVYVRDWENTMSRFELLYFSGVSILLGKFWI